MKKTLKNIKKNSYIFVAIMALLASFTLQTLWVTKTMEYSTLKIRQNINELLVRCLFEEAECRSKNIPEDSEITGSNNDYAEFYDFEYFNEGIYKLSKEDINITRLDSIIQQKIKGGEYDYAYNIYYIDKGKSKNVYRSKQSPYVLIGSVKSSVVPLRINHSLGIQIEFLNPYNLFIKEMGLIVLSSFIISLLLIWCIVKQLSIIRIQRKTMQMRKDFTYAMVHDMKTPLSTITLGVNGLENEKIFSNLELRNKYMRILKDEAQHLFVLVNKILTISKLEEGRLDMHMENVELVPMVENLEEKFSAKATKEIRFTNRIEADTVFADAEYLGEALSNLIDNAIKYSRKDVDTEIEIGSRDTGNGVEISVRDNGLGISAKDQKVIFDKFERASASGRTFKNNGPAGFGLGLNYVLQVIEAHGGIVGVDSEVGEYTTFTILLPYGKDEDGDETEKCNSQQ